jgi:hypothetical protein
MTAPSVRSFNVTSDTSGASTPVNLPGTIVTGDLLVAVATSDAPGTTETATISTGWVRTSHETQGSNVLRHSTFMKIADATNALTLTGAAQDVSVVCAAIQDHGVTAPLFAQVIMATAATGTTGNADPPATGTIASMEWLVMATCGIDMTNSGDTLSAQPSTYTDIGRNKSASSTSSCACGMAVKAVTGTSENPGAFTNTSRPWIAKTLAIPPFVAPVYLTGTRWGFRNGLIVPVSVISDDFDRGNGGLGSNWTAAQNPLTILDGEVVVATNPGSMFWNGGTFAANQWSQADVTVKAAGYYMVSVLVRATQFDGGAFYFARLCGSCGDVAVGKRFDFAQSEFASGGSLGSTVPTTRTLRLEAEGTSLRAYVNESLIVSTTDVSISGGRPGIHISTSNASDASINNWSGGDL